MTMKNKENVNAGEVGSSDLVRLTDSWHQVAQAVTERAAMGIRSALLLSGLVSSHSSPSMPHANKDSAPIAGVASQGTSLMQLDAPQSCSNASQSKQTGLGSYSGYHEPNARGERRG